MSSRFKSVSSERRRLTCLSASLNKEWCRERAPQSCAYGETLPKRRYDGPESTDMTFQILAQARLHQRFRGVSGGHLRAVRHEITGVFQNEAQGDARALWPFYRLVECRVTPGGDIDAVLLKGAKPILGRTADIEIFQQRFQSDGQGRGRGRGQYIVWPFLALVFESSL